MTWVQAGLVGVGWYAFRVWRRSRPRSVPSVTGDLVRVPPRWTRAQWAEWKRAFDERMAALEALADGTPQTPGVYVVTCRNCSTVYCTTLDGAITSADHFAHIDAGPLYPYVDAEIYQDGKLVCVYDCYSRTPRMVGAAADE